MNEECEAPVRNSFALGTEESYELLAEPWLAPVAVENRFTSFLRDFP